VSGVLVLGIDPGSLCTGWGLVSETSGRAGLVDCGTIRTRASDGLGPRLAVIYQKIAELVALHGPDEAAVESVFTAKSAASALKLGQARGAAIAALAVAGLPVSAYAPTLVKKSLVGTGRAEKSQVAFMVGQVMALTRGRADPQELNRLFREKLN